MKTDAMDAAAAAEAGGDAIVRQVISRWQSAANCRRGFDAIDGWMADRPTGKVIASYWSVGRSRHLSPCSRTKTGRPGPAGVSSPAVNSAEGWLLATSEATTTMTMTT